MRLLLAGIAVWLSLSVVTAVVLSLGAKGARRGQHLKRFTYRRRREDVGRA